MDHGRIASIFALGLLLAACSNAVEVASHVSSGGSGGSGGSGDPSTAGAGGGTGGDATGGAGGAQVDPAIVGHYMQQAIGNCINAETWLSFDASGSFTHTIVDRNFCSEHSVSAHPGAASIDDQTIEITWSPEGGSELRRFTYARVDPYLPDPSFPPFEDYVPGTAGLNRMAYARVGDAPTWHREDRLISKTEIGGLYDVAITIDVSLDAPLITPPEGPTACAMTASILVATSLDGEPPATLAETFELPCTYEPHETRSWIRILANGFEESMWDNSWSEYLSEKGIWQKYPALVTNPFYEAFRPVFFYEPGKEARLFHDVSFAWYAEMKNPPPATVD